jgi:hypothetical protein
MRLGLCWPGAAKRLSRQSQVAILRGGVVLGENTPPVMKPLLFRNSSEAGWKIKLRSIRKQEPAGARPITPRRSAGSAGLENAKSRAWSGR